MDYSRVQFMLGRSAMFCLLKQACSTNRSEIADAIFYVNYSLQERKLKDAQMRATINQKLVETGERERLKELLRARLIECGWRDQLKAYCKEIVQQKGLEHITVDDLVSEITPRGRSLVPDEVKKELLQRIRTFLAQQSNM
ncbi:transcription and mRNA export factor eny2-like [Plakobranchus ocellatus]|uniref:Transcription and mRNA export factor ENY2 n=1 Tax=Plakobranchus ocellatus TaxID=259542 RepID=A0AAV4C437_9GAST|nr:transcription and mRNA export factor eny2-like [Plakobranchus ocellatus]